MKKTLFKIITVSSLFFAGVSCIKAQYRWTQMANFPGVVRDLSISFSIGNFGYLGGGLDGYTYYSDMYRWNQYTNTWSAIASYPGAGQSAPISVTIEGKGYVGTGWGSGGATSDFWCYDTTSNTWTAKAAFPGTPRYDASAFVLGHKLYLIGGSTGGAPYLSDVWVYDAHTNKWKQLKNSPTGDMEAPVAFTIGNRGYMGMGWDGSLYNSACWKYDTTNDSWISIASSSQPASNEVEAFVLGSKSYVCVGGNNNGPLKVGYAYDTLTGTWSEFTNMGANGIERRWASAFSIGNDGYIGNGVDSLGNYLNTFWQYGPTSDEGIAGVKSSLNISIYPNPSNGLMNLIYNGNLQKGELVITDLLGKVIDSHEIIGSQGQMQLNETYFNNGMYFYQVLDSGSLISSGKFIIAK